MLKLLQKLFRRKENKKNAKTKMYRLLRMNKQLAFKPNR